MAEGYEDVMAAGGEAIVGWYMTCTSKSQWSDALLHVAGDHVILNSSTLDGRNRGRFIFYNHPWSIAFHYSFSLSPSTFYSFQFSVEIRCSVLSRPIKAACHVLIPLTDAFLSRFIRHFFIKFCFHDHVVHGILSILLQNHTFTASIFLK